MAEGTNTSDSVSLELNPRRKDPWAEQMRVSLESVTLELPINDPEAMTLKTIIPQHYEILEPSPDFRIKIRKENLDPEGIFNITIEPTTRRIRVAWWAHSVFGEEVQLREIYYGTNPVSIYDTIILKHPSMQPSSSSALAYDLAIAEVALKKGLGYLPAKLIDLL